MVTRKRINYNYLLDKIKKECDSHHVNEQGVVLDLNGEEETNERVIANVNFGNLYHMAYNATKKIAHNGTINSMEMYQKLAYYDYSTFNSFINNCINECRVYNDIGGGEFFYIPYQELANYMLNNEETKNIVIEYLKCEFKDLSFEKGKRLSKR